MLIIQVDIIDPHLHPNSLFSGVYWIKTPMKSGNLMLYDPRPGVQMTMPNRKEGKLPPELWREVHYEPKAGRCIMFPSWLWHEVKPNKSNDTRISVSFNFLQLFSNHHSIISYNHFNNISISFTIRPTIHRILHSIFFS